MFERSEYKVSVNESAPVGSRLVRVRANDADEGKNSRLFYHMANPNDKFVVDKRTGLLSIRSPLKCSNAGGDPDCLPCLKEARLCSLVIVATDGGQPRQSAQTLVKVGLLDTNEHAPKISFRYLPDQSLPYAVVDEAATAGTSVAAVTVADPDRGPYGETSIKIVSGNELRHFKLETTGGSSLFILRVAPRARLEGGQVYNLTLKARDKGSPSKFSEASLIVKVNEVNEYAPEFEKTVYNAEIMEGALPGSSVMIMRASDADRKATLTFSIEETSVNTLDWFQIHPLSGLITTKASLDRETQELFKLSIKVTDGASQPKSAFTTVMITILDENDETPKFGEPFYNVTVPEDIPPRQTFAAVTATDLDKGENGRVTYKIMNSNANNKVFDINKANGEIYAVSNLDRETVASYTLKVQAADLGGLMSEVDVFIKISDANDNSPLFYPVTYHVILPERSSSFDNKMFLTKVEASDLDEDETLVFQWQDDNEAAQEFQIDADTGELFVDRRFLSLLESEARVKVLHVIATDKGGRKSPQPAQVYVYPRRSLSETRVFRQKSYEFSLVEDSRLREPILNRQVGFVDLDSEAARIVALEITDGDLNGSFKIDKASGRIATQKTIDREKISEYQLKIVASVSNGFEVCEVRIIVEDINDDIPKFDDTDPDVIHLNANAPVGHKVHRVIATDADAGDNGKIKFMLDDNQNNEVFEIDEATGVIVLKTSLQESRGVDSFEVTVTMNDRGLPTLSNVKSYR